MCVVGAGAIGGFLGTRLARCGAADVSALARGATLAALRTDGWWLEEGGQMLHVPARASDRPEDLGPQDLVILAVKGPSIAALAPTLRSLLRPQTLILPAINGVPWWFAAATPVLAGQPLQSVDPGGAVLDALPLAQVIGCVVHASTASPQPGRVVHKRGRRLIVGEPADGLSDRVERVARLLDAAGFETERCTRLRHALWYKLWGNMTMNPVSALTGATVDRILADPLLRGFCSAVMREAALLGERLGCVIDEDAEARHGVTLKLGAAHEIAQRLQQPTPHLDALLGLARVYGRTRGLYPN